MGHFEKIALIMFNAWVDWKLLARYKKNYKLSFLKKKKLVKLKSKKLVRKKFRFFSFKIKQRKKQEDKSSKSIQKKDEKLKKKKCPLGTLGAKAEPP